MKLKQLVVAVLCAVACVSCSDDEKGVLTVLDTAPINVKNAGGDIEIPFEANTDAYVTIDEASTSWLSYKTTRSVSEHSLILTATENMGEVARTATVTITSTRKTVAPTVLTITQAPKVYEDHRMMYILGEGRMNNADSRLAMYNFNDESLDCQFFISQNEGAKLGDTAQDLLVYGSKAYVLVNVSDKVVVMNAVTGKLIKEVSFAEKTQPRFAVGANGKVYMSTYMNGVAVMDTTSLEITKNIALSGAFSENIVRIDNNLYVANSGNKGDSYGGSGTTLSVVSLDSEEETATITVPQNPNRLRVTKDKRLFLSCWGNWTSVDAHLYEIDYTNKEVLASYEDFTCSKMTVTDKYVYCYHFSYMTYQTEYKRLNLATDEVTDYLDSSEPRGYHLQSPYDLAVDPSNNDVFLLDQSGWVLWMNEEGALVKNFELTPDGVNAVNPNCVRFVDYRVDVTPN